MPKNLCIYHANCVDGVGAAFAVWYHQAIMGKEFEFIPASYGKTWKEVVGDYFDMVIADTFDHQNYECWIVDFSFPKDQLLEMADVFDAVIVLDHHKTAKEDCATIKAPPNLDIVFDMERSGAGIAWDYCSSTEHNRPKVINLIEDRDLWKFKHHDSKAVNMELVAFKKSEPLTEAEFKQFAFFLQDAEIAHIASTGRAKLDYHNARIAEVARTAQFTEWEIDYPLNPNATDVSNIVNYTVALVNCPYFQASDMGDFLKKEADIICLYNIHLGKRTVAISLRSANVDVAAIATEFFHGGGHKLAAGGWMDTREFLATFGNIGV